MTAGVLRGVRRVMISSGRAAKRWSGRALLIVKAKFSMGGNAGLDFSMTPHH